MQTAAAFQTADIPQQLPLRRVEMLPEHASAFAQYLKKDVTVQVVFPEDSPSDNLGFLFDMRDIKFDEVSRRRITSVLGDKDQTRFGSNNHFSFTMMRNLADGVRSSFVFRLAPLLETLIVFTTEPE